ncbi:MAG: FKBP-type peptidyl-prolyl cis-trans isomerase [Planctomycetota bacterium]
MMNEGGDEGLAEGDDFELEYAMFHPNGELLDGTFGSKMMLSRAHAAQLPFLTEVVEMMKVGSVVRVEVPVKACFPRGIPPQLGELGEDGILVWQIELKRAVKPLKVPEFAMPADDVLKSTASGLKYEVIKEGTGASPVMGQQVTVHYAGWLTDGKLFDASYSRGQTSTFALGRVIQGWNEGLQLMKEGAIYKLVIPGNLGYGPRGNAPDIPPDATLVFQVELVKVGG